jgi:hypothetical protein
MIGQRESDLSIVKVNSRYLNTSTLLPDQHSQAMVYEYISKIKDDESESFEKLDFTIAEIKKKTGIRKQEKQEDILKRFQESLQLRFSYEDSDEIISFAGVFQLIKLNKKTRVMTFEMNKELIYIFKQLRRNYTKIPYEHIKNFKSRYTTKIFEEIVSQYMIVNSKGGTTASIIKTLDQLNNLYNTKYPSGKIEERVLKQIKKDINNSINELNKNTIQFFDYKKQRKNKDGDINIIFTLTEKK